MDTGSLVHHKNLLGRGFLLVEREMCPAWLVSGPRGLSCWSFLLVREREWAEHFKKCVGCICYSCTCYLDCTCYSWVEWPGPGNIRKHYKVEPLKTSLWPFQQRITKTINGVAYVDCTSNNRLNLSSSAPRDTLLCGNYSNLLHPKMWQTSL